MREDKSVRLVLLDLLMPDKSGIEVLDDIQVDADDWMSSIPVLVMSSSTNKDDQEECLRLGAKEYL